MYRKTEASSEDELPRYKTRLVVKGYSQRKGIDFDEIFSLVVKHYSIKVMLSMVAMWDLELEQLDVTTVFLYGSLDEEMYILQLDGFV